MLGYRFTLEPVKNLEKKNRIDIVLKHINNPYGQAHSNNITIEIDPTSKIYITINGKKIDQPGIRREDLTYEFSKSEMVKVPDGYERLLHDVFLSMIQLTLPIGAN